MTRLRAAWSRVGPLVPTRRGTAAVALAALVSHSLVTAVFPVIEGRDYVTYTRVYTQMWSWHSVIPWEMLWRMPVAPALMGLPLDLGGPWAARVAITLAFVATVVMWFRIALRFGPLCAAAVAVVLVCSPTFLLLFHRYSSDAVAAVVFALLALAVVRASERPGVAGIALLGLATVVAVLTRPAHQALIPLALLPLVLPGSWRVRVTRAALCTALVLVPLGAWMLMNGARYDDRALSRGGGAWLPFYRVYLDDRLVDPANGSASAELARVVRTRLLVGEPYVSYGIDEQRFFGEPTTRYHEDLVGLTDRVYGWDDRNAILRRAALEGIREHPYAFARGVAGSFVSQLRQAFVILPPAAIEPEPVATTDVGGVELPTPSEGGSIPAASFSYWLSRPDNAFDEVWTSPVDHHVVSTRPDLLGQLEDLEQRVDGLRLEPSHGGSPSAMRWLNRASRVYPPALLWLLVGLGALVFRRPDRLWLAGGLAFAAGAILLATLLSVPPVPELGAPFFPAFVLFGLAALLGPARPGRTVRLPTAPGS